MVIWGRVSGFFWPRSPALFDFGVGGCPYSWPEQSPDGQVGRIILAAGPGVPDTLDSTSQWENLTDMREGLVHVIVNLS